MNNKTRYKNQLRRPCRSFSAFARAHTSSICRAIPVGHFYQRRTLQTMNTPPSQVSCIFFQNCWINRLFLSDLYILEYIAGKNYRRLLSYLIVNRDKNFLHNQSNLFKLYDTEPNLQEERSRELDSKSNNVSASQKSKIVRLRSHQLFDCTCSTVVLFHEVPLMFCIFL